MKKLLLFLILLLPAFVAITAKRTLKIYATPEDARIYVDGNYIGDGFVEMVINRSDNFLVIKIDKDGYLPIENKFYTSDKRKSISYSLRRNLFYDASVASGNVNKYFNVDISKELYTVNENGKKDTDKAWRLIHQILLNYFDELQTSDISSGFIQTPWKYRQFNESKIVIRTRATVRQMGITDDKLTFQIKVSSEQAPLAGMSSENSYTEISRMLKEYEDLISEFQARLSEK